MDSELDEDSKQQIHSYAHQCRSWENEELATIESKIKEMQEKAKEMQQQQQKQLEEQQQREKQFEEEQQQRQKQFDRSSRSILMA